jgi:hypothetical protein
VEDEGWGDAQAAVRERVHVTCTPRGKSALVWTARLQADGQVFERRVEGQALNSQNTLRSRAIDAVVADYLDWVNRTHSGA